MTVQGQDLGVLVEDKHEVVDPVLGDADVHHIRGPGPGDFPLVVRSGSGFRARQHPRPPARANARGRPCSAAPTQTAYIFTWRHRLSEVRKFTPWQ